MQNQTSTPNLDFIINKVNDWRGNRKNRSELMSEELKILIVSLFPFYSINQISSYLRISVPTLYNFQKLYSTNRESQENKSFPDYSNNSDEQQISFVPFHLSSLLSSPNEQNEDAHQINNTTDSIGAASSICLIEKKDGTKLTLTTRDPTSIIGAFLCSN